MATGETPSYETVVLAEPPAKETAREDCAASSSVVTADRTPRAGESVTQLLSEQSGAVVTRLGGMGATATVSLRGSTANQVSVYLDGVPLNSATGGGVDLGALPLADVERIEIYRGMSPVGFGASAIGGVVSITTAVPKNNRAEVEVGGGSFGTYHGSVRGALALGRLRIYRSVHVLTSNGDFSYLDTAGNLDTGRNPASADDHIAQRRNNDLRQVDGMLRAVVDLSNDRHLTVSALFFDRAQGLPGSASIAHPVARLTTLRSTGIIGYQSGAAFGPGGKLRATLYGNYDYSHLADPAPDLAMSSTDARDRTYAFGATSVGRAVARPWLVLSGILDLRYDRFSPSDTGASGSPGTRWFGAAGLESDFWVQALGLDVVPSFRIEVAREETSGRNNFDRLLPTSPPTSHVLPIARLALVKEICPWLSLRMNGGRYARLPSLVELYGNTGYLVGNVGLRPESGINADFGPRVSWEGDSGRLLWTTAGFVSLVDDLIQYRYGNGRARPANLGSARIVGVESDARLELGRHLRAVLSATFTDARDTASVESAHGKQLPFRPRYRFYLRPEWRAVQIASRIALGIYADCDVTAGNYSDSTNLVRVPGRALFGAGVYADLPGGFKVRASGRNLANSHIYDISNYPLPGRELYLTLGWSAQSKPQNED
jgi:outer membrane cobalamin receptor